MTTKAATRRRSSRGTSLSSKPSSSSSAKSSSPSSSSSGSWFPRSSSVLKLLLTVRLSAALWSNVSDCDEVYNYWEPLHYLLYQSGFQTWEYAPQYALRSYLYLWLWAVPAGLFNAVLYTSSKFYIFFLLRCLLALLSSLAEFTFILAIETNLGANVARLTLITLVFSPGMFIATPALLPSSSAMVCNMLAVAFWLNEKHALAVLFVALASMLCWPFAALLGLPIALDLVFRRRRPVLFIKASLASALAIGLPMVMVDSVYFGRFVLAPINIIVYNVFNSGSDLYGTEDAVYYAKNLLLNMNVAFVLSMLIPIALLWLSIKQQKQKMSSASIPLWLLNLPLGLWLGVFWLQSHKEERFLFPIYPLMALASATVLDVFVSCFKSKTVQTVLTSGFVVLSTVLGVMRVTALYLNYGAPINMWLSLNTMSDPNSEAVVCMGKEWHRFPSSFFLPRPNWRLAFLKSAFKGQLPQPFLSDSTATVRSNFNDKNEEEYDRYGNLEQCDYIVDLDRGSEATSEEPSYIAMRDKFEIVSSSPFLDAHNSHWLFRAFYVPFVSHKYVKFLDYVVLTRRTRHSN